MLSVIVIAAVAFLNPLCAASQKWNSETQVSNQLTLALPDTPAANQLLGWLSAFNTGDPDIIRQFMAAHRAPPPGVTLETLIERQTGFYKQTHGFDLRKMMSSSPERITVAAMARHTGYWMAITVSVNAQPPYAISGFNFRYMEAPAELLPTQTLSIPEIRTKVDELIRKLIDLDRFSGAILVAKDGKPFYEKSSGWASRTWNIPNRIDTKFNVASMGKMFTAVAIAQLAEQGKLSYSDLVGKFLPDYPKKDVVEKVTVHHLLSHTSGLPLEPYPATAATRCPQVFSTITEYLNCLHWDIALKFEPGARFDYSNYGFLLLGAIIEKASGQGYYDYIRDHIYKPAGMINTDYELDTDPPNLASGYADGPNGSRRNNIFDLPRKGMPYGLGYSTVEDLLKFHVALRSGKLLNAKSLETVWTGKVDSFDNMQYGYGFNVKRYNGTRIVGHGGGWHGITTDMDMYPDLGYTVVILNNIDSSPTYILYKLREWLTQGQTKNTR